MQVNLKVKGTNSSILLPVIGKKSSSLGSVTLLLQPVLERENAEFKIKQHLTKQQFHGYLLPV